jgi:hypothetical protein
MFAEQGATTAAFLGQAETCNEVLTVEIKRNLRRGSEGL